MPNWLFSRDAICHGRASRANSVPYRIWHFLHPWRSDVLAACLRSVCTYGRSLTSLLSRHLHIHILHRPQAIGTTFVECHSQPKNISSLSGRCYQTKFDCLTLGCGRSATTLVVRRSLPLSQIDLVKKASDPNWFSVY